MQRAQFLDRSQLRRVGARRRKRKLRRIAEDMHMAITRVGGHGEVHRRSRLGCLSHSFAQRASKRRRSGGNKKIASGKQIDAPPSIVAALNRPLDSSHCTKRRRLFTSGASRSQAANSWWLRPAVARTVVQPAGSFAHRPPQTDLWRATRPRRRPVPAKLRVTPDYFRHGWRVPRILRFPSSPAR